VIEAVVWLVVWFVVWAVGPWLLWAAGLVKVGDSYVNQKGNIALGGSLMVSAVFLWGFSLVMGILQLIAVVQMAVA